ncbi:MAG: M1 family aminopeptidase [Phycisphaerales bacterium]
MNSCSDNVSSGASAGARRGARALILASLLLSGTALGDDAGVWWRGECVCHRAAPDAWADDSTPRAVASFDEATGRSLLNYPPHRFVDYKRMTLAITIPDMNTPALGAAAQYTIEPIAGPVDHIMLRAGPPGSMQIKRVTIGADAGSAADVAFTHEGEELNLSFAPALTPGHISTLTVVYQLTDPPAGLTWTPETPEWKGRPAQLHSQGQPETNHYWFPCRDFPNERLETELIVTVPEGYQALSNGRLVESRSATIAAEASMPGSKPVSARTFHWLQDKPHVNYLVTLVVGKFDVVDVSGGGVPMPVYAPLGRGGDVKRTYGRTGQMIDLFAGLVDEPYPWDKYAQSIVWNFGAGGMENTSATTMFDTAILDERALLDGDLDGLISHELAHQWFGDLVTCNSWEHIWLNEGFATYFSHLWFQKRDGNDAYLSGLFGNFQQLIQNDKPDAPHQPAMCSKEYADTWEAFGRAANPYPKGASILHMLRRKVGDQLFFDALALYVDRYKFQTVETDSLRYCFEEVSGLSLDRFFRQWCYRPGVPTADVVISWDASASSLNISLTQTQHIDGNNPAFFYTLPVWVKLPGGETRTLDVPVDGKTQSATFQLPAAPVLVAVDPELSVLGSFSVTAPNAATNWRDLLSQGPTAASKLQAIAALRRMGAGNVPSDAVMALSALAHDSTAYVALRTAAAQALGEIGTPDLPAALVLNPPQDARVRKTAIEQAPRVYEQIKGGSDGAAARLLDAVRGMATSDPSYAARAAAIRAMVKMGDPGAGLVVVESLKVESQHDEVRQAALESLPSLDSASALADAVKYAGPGSYPRTRPSAINAIGALARHDPDLALGALRTLISDSNWRVARSAGEAMVRLGDARAIPMLEAFAASAPTPAAASMARRWIEQLTIPHQ